MASPQHPLSGDRRVWGVLLLCVIAAVGVGLLRSPRVDEALLASLPAPAEVEDFTSSVTCQACHPGSYDSWHRSYHRTMTQVATPASVLARWDDLTLEDRGYSYHLWRNGEEFWVEMPDPLWFMERSDQMPATPPRIQARVVMTTGSHHLQNYWIRRPDVGEFYLRPDDGSLIQLPWVWLVDAARWVPNQDSFLGPPSVFVERPLRWNANCSGCHSVATQPRTSEGYDDFDTRTVELGIACEACHGPAAEHVRVHRSPVHRYLRHFQRVRGRETGDPTIVNPVDLDQSRSVAACAQCHSFGMWRDQETFRASGVPFRAGEELDEHRAVFRYSHDPEDPLLVEALGGDSLALEGRYWRDGTMRVAGREFNGLLETACFTQGELTCLTCHSMHEYGSPARQVSPEASGDTPCLGCHVDLARDVTAHTRHALGSTGSECMNCHMPHTTYGLFRAMRSHRIDSPTLPMSTEHGRPNACNLCHLDQTLEWTDRYLNEWYGQPRVELDPDQRSIAASILWIMRGDAVQRTVVAWHMGWEPAHEASGNTWLAPYLAQLLVDAYSATRQVAYQSILTVPGFERFDFNYVADRDEHDARASEALDRWMWAGGPAQTGSHLLLDSVTGIDFDVWIRLLAERDQTRLRIIE